MKISTADFSDTLSPEKRPDKIVRKLEDFPELMQALRNGDRLAARLLFAQLYDYLRWNEALRSKPS